MSDDNSVQDVQKFMINLSQRVGDENGLSNVTWAMCKASAAFQKAFLDFFFGEQDWSRITRFDREASFSGGRPDFYLETPGQSYLIEVKIGDQSHHWEQYVTQIHELRNAKRGYITNYIVESSAEYEAYKKHYETITTWREFWKHLKSDKPEIEQLRKSIDKGLLSGYIQYLQSVCNIGVIRHMQLQHIHSLLSLMNALEEIVDCTHAGLISKRYGRRERPDKPIRHGLFFALSQGPTADKPCCWGGWFGVYYGSTPDDVGIYVEFEDESGWGTDVCRLIDQDESRFASMDYSDPPFKEENAYYFRMSDDKKEPLSQFDAIKTPEEQVAMLQNFFHEVLERISPGHQTPQ